MIQKVLIFNRGAPISLMEVEAAICNNADAEPHEIIDPDVLKNGVAAIGSPSQPHRFEDFMDTLAGLWFPGPEIHHGNRSQAARLLEISRPTLHAKMDKYDIKFKIDVS